MLRQGVRGRREEKGWAKKDMTEIRRLKGRER